jgi:His-Xaa-Ser system radical SAM maturase HxsC
MCCQPPHTHNDIEELYWDNIERINNAPSDLPLLCLTGGEPTLLGDKLISLISCIREKLPQTEILLLTNARLFSDEEYAANVATAGEGHLFVGTELHSDFANDHDYIAGKENAYKEAVIGMYNLAAHDIEIELRVIICKENFTRLNHIAQFIHKNLPFVGKIAFMGMECVGYAYDNYESVWVDPIDYSDVLEDAVRYLSEWRYNVNIYNIPLCLLPEGIRQFSRQSISDWKNEYSDLCDNCLKKRDCCGLFSTSIIPYQRLHCIK